MWGREPAPLLPDPERGLGEGSVGGSLHPFSQTPGEGKVGRPHPFRRDVGRGLEEGECQSQGVNL